MPEPRRESASLKRPSNAWIPACAGKTYRVFMDKQKILSTIISKLQTDIAVAAQAVEIAHDTATHKDCLGSSKYETMGTEASYLAQGQGLRLLELERALAYFKQLTLSKPSTTIVLSSLVSLVNEQGKQQLLWLAADAGGLNVQLDKQNITIITPQAPLGSVLLGKTEGDDFEIQLAGTTHTYEVLAVV